MMGAKSNFIGVNRLGSCLTKLGLWVFIALISLGASASPIACEGLFETNAQLAEREFAELALRPSGRYQPSQTPINEILQDPSYKVIVLGRHGKASEENKFTSAERSQDPNKVELDLLRPLAKKGRRAAKSMSELLGSLPFRAVAMWGSVALRVQESAQPTKEALGDRVKIFEFQRELYYADVAAQMQRRLETDIGETIPHVFFWGHGKSTLEVFKKLTGTTNGFLPTAGVLIVAVKAKSWSDVFNGLGSDVVGFAWSPKGTHVLEGSEASVSTFEP